MAKKSAKKNPARRHGGKRPGAGRKLEYGEHLVTFSVSVPMSVANHLTKLAEEEGISRSRVFVEIATGRRKPVGK